MQVFHSIPEWLSLRRALSAGDSLGFVPTMGNLHLGHQSLITQSQKDNSLTVVSIFVNPTQFNQESDFKHYPRTIDADLERLSSQQVDYCFLPRAKDLYFDDYTYQIHETKLSTHLEGKHRPGHFTGVLTIVMKLLQLINPHHAYFGEKDYQQYQLLQSMANAFFMPVAIKLCPTIREASGLAFSSRNQRLTAETRLLADDFARIFHQRDLSLEIILQQLQAKNIEVDYLEEFQKRRFIAVHIGGVRLIDNYMLEEQPYLALS